MRRKIKDLQPYLDYFKMLHTYEEKGFLQMEPRKHEAYITASAIASLANADIRMDDPECLMAYTSVLRHIRTYSGWRSREGRSYASRLFAVHVVNDEQPHDPLCTILITRRRRWWSLFRQTDCYEVVDYVNSNRP